jgi:hypothetical protein
MGWRARETPLFIAIMLVLALGVLVALGMASLAVWVVTWPSPPDLGQVAESQRVPLLQLALAISAFAGGVVALTVAYRRQQVMEAAHQLTIKQEHRESTRVYNERFGSASAQLGNEKSAVRLAGVYALAGLADDWEEQRQVCVDVLCAYMRLPYDIESAAAGESEVRRTIMRTIAEHLRDDSYSRQTVSWQGLELDFTGAVLEGTSFVRANFKDTVALFDRAVFKGRRTTFHKARFERSTIFFRRAIFEGGDVSFEEAKIGPQAVLNFEGAHIATSVFRFTNATMTDARVSLVEATVDAQIDAADAVIADSTIAHSAGWTPPEPLARWANIEAVNDLWRQYGPAAGPSS